MKFETYLFDIDHTLDPFSQGVEDWYIQNTGNFVAKHLGISFDEAIKVTEDYYRLFGATLSGLMYFHDIRAEDYYDAKGPVPLVAIEKCERTMAKVRELDGQKIAFTNASTDHADLVLSHLDLKGAFEAIYTLDNIGYWGKPFSRAFHHVFTATKLDPRATVFFEDSPKNLVFPKACGMTTVLIGDQHFKIGEAPDYVDVHALTLSQALEAVDAL